MPFDRVMSTEFLHTRKHQYAFESFQMLLFAQYIYIDVLFEHGLFSSHRINSHTQTITQIRSDIIYSTFWALSASTDFSKVIWFCESGHVCNAVQKCHSLYLLVKSKEFKFDWVAEQWTVAQIEMIATKKEQQQRVVMIKSEKHLM